MCACVCVGVCLYESKACILTLIKKISKTSEYVIFPSQIAKETFTHFMYSECKSYAFPQTCRMALVKFCGSMFINRFYLY